MDDNWLKVEDNKVINLEHVLDVQVVLEGARPHVIFVQSFSNDRVYLDMASTQLLERLIEWEILSQANIKKLSTITATQQERVISSFKRLQEVARRLHSKE